MQYNLLIQIGRWIRRHPIQFIIVILIVIYILASSIIIFFEKVGFLEATLRIIPSFLGELGAIEINPTGFASMLGLFVYAGFLCILIGKAAEVLVSISLKGGIVLKKVRYKNHIVICGWNYQGAKIIECLLTEDIHHEKPIVILADLDKPPYSSDKVDFISGKPWRKEDLIRAGILDADSAIILTDITCEKSKNPDADALMITLAIESFNRDVHTCVQLLSSENREHLENANADEIICLDQVGGNLAVTSTLNHGLSKIINELLTFNLGSEFYRFKRKIPEKYIGKSFTDVSKNLIDNKMILIAIETQKDEFLLEEYSHDWIHSSTETRAMLINPQGEYILRENDSLFIISEKEPILN
ncbi:NAD-binding protein [Thermoplasmatota archaeon]